MENTAPPILVALIEKSFFKSYDLHIMPDKPYGFPIILLHWPNIQNPIFVSLIAENPILHRFLRLFSMLLVAGGRRGFSV